MSTPDRVAAPVSSWIIAAILFLLTVGAATCWPTADGAPGGLDAAHVQAAERSALAAVPPRGERPEPVVVVLGTSLSFFALGEPREPLLVESVSGERMRILFVAAVGPFRQHELKDEVLEVRPDLLLVQEDILLPGEQRAESPLARTAEAIRRLAKAAVSGLRTSRPAAHEPSSWPYRAATPNETAVEFLAEARQRGIQTVLLSIARSPSREQAYAGSIGPWHQHVVIPTAARLSIPRWRFEPVGGDHHYPDLSHLGPSGAAKFRATLLPRVEAALRTAG